MSRSLLRGWVRIRDNRYNLGWHVLALCLLSCSSVDATAVSPPDMKRAATLPADAEQFLDRSFLAQAIPTPRINRPVLQIGSQGSDVSELQAALKLLGYYSGVVDGTYSQATADAVIRFQKAAGLNPDGVMGPGTWEQLFPPIGYAEPDPCFCADGSTGVVPEGNFPVLQIGMRGTAVVGLQQRLKARGLYLGAIDGIFGQETQSAVVLAQQNFGLIPNGIVDFSTWDVLLR
jgi:N-acetylmuramoyl-L-alanine amidase